MSDEEAERAIQTLDGHDFMGRNVVVNEARPPREGSQASELDSATYVDLMDQYYPAGKVSGTEYVEISRRITPKEYRLALEGARTVSLRRLDHRAPDKHLAIWQ